MYEITQWNGKQELAELDNTTISIDPILLNDAILKLMNKDTTIEDDVIDIDFNFGVKKADRYDYCFALFSGILSSLISKYVKMSGDLDIDLEKMDFAQLLYLVKDINIKVQKNNEKDTADIEKTLNNIEEIIKDANSYKNLVVDFASDFSMMGLLISIIEKVFGKEIGYDENNNLVINEAKETFDNLSFLEKVEFAIFEWFLEQVDQYKQNGKFKEQLKNILEWRSIVKKLEPIIKDFSQINLSKEELKQWFVNLIQDKNQRISKLDFLQKENIPTQFNKIMIHTYVHIKNLIEQVKEHKITTLEGLEIINFNRIDNERVILRLETVSTGVFFAMDASAAVIQARKCGAEANIFGILKVFANTINFSNILTFTYVVKQDATYIKEDIDEILHKAKIEVVHHCKDISADELNSYISLNDPETRILYSLKLHMIEEDIQCTKLSADQQLKNEWKKQWMEVSKNSLHMAKLYEPNIQKVYQALITHAENTIDNRTWLYNIVLELCLFSPYYQIDEDEKKYKKLKLVNKNLDYMKNYFCEGQKYVSFKEIKQFESLYKHYHGYIENKNLKMAGAAGAVVAVGAGVGAGAMLFAPQIAVALFGGAFPGLHGAALVNAALAAAGGGSLVAGGFGMAGGSVIIAGGGALLGMSTASVATMGLLSSPNFVQTDDAKLLAKCNYVLLNQMHKIDVVVAIQRMTEESLNDSKTQLKVLESAEDKSDECKKTIAALKKSVKYMERTNDELKKLIAKEEKKSD
ncbi:hypothetical protein CGK76_11210 [Erysipelotrichaceae bacterium 7770_A6]|nr:hypothetical protein [Erysipelotrichaceae bacterium 7770_A6]